MKKSKMTSLFGLTAVAGLVFLSCTKEVKSGPNFIFKPAPSKGVVAKFDGKNITMEEVLKGAENEIYEAEKKVYDLKMAKLKGWLIDQMMQKDPKKKGMTNDEYLKKHIAGTVKVSEEEIKAFIKQRQIPDQYINPEMTGRITKFLMAEKEKTAIEDWFNKKTANMPVEIYLNKPTRPVFDVKVGDAPFVGKADAKVTIVEFSDFQCPFCQKGAKVMDEIKKKYGNKVKIAFKNFPLPFHKNAKTAAVAGLCANEQSPEKFWKLHDLMFADQQNLTNDGLVAKAKTLGLDMKKFEACLSSNKFLAKVEADKAEGQKAGVQSTPTFFINGKMISGAQPLEVFSEEIDQELSM